MVDGKGLVHYGEAFVQYVGTYVDSNRGGEVWFVDGRMECV